MTTQNVTKTSITQRVRTDGQLELRQPPNWCGKAGLWDPNIPNNPRYKAHVSRKGLSAGN